MSSFCVVYSSHCVNTNNAGPRIVCPCVLTANLHVSFVAVLSRGHTAERSQPLPHADSAPSVTEVSRPHRRGGGDGVDGRGNNQTVGSPPWDGTLACVHVQAAVGLGTARVHDGSAA